MTTKPWRVQARESTFVVLGANGDEMLESVKEYDTAASAKRAARNFAEAMKRGVVFEYENADGELVQEDITEAADVPAATAGGTINPPEPGKSRHASSPYAQ